jgi:hypothetical protein
LGQDRQRLATEDERWFLIDPQGIFETNIMAVFERIVFVVYTPLSAKWMWRDFLLKRFRESPFSFGPFFNSVQTQDLIIAH